MYERKDRNTESASLLGLGYLWLMANERGEPEDYIFLDINTEFELLLGLRCEDVLGKRASCVFDGGVPKGLDRFAYYASVIRSGRAQEAVQWVEPPGRYYRITVIPVRDDIFALTMREAATPELPFSREREEEETVLASLQTIFNRTHDSILLVEHRDGMFRFVRNNQLHQRLTGFSDVAGTTPVMLLGEEVGKMLVGHYEQCVRTGRTVAYEQWYDFASGARVWHTEVTPLFGKDGIRYLLCSSKDITELKKAQEENEIISRRLQSMFDRHTAVMLMIEPFTGKIVDANPSASTFYGYTKEELKALYIWNLNIMASEEVERCRMMAYAQQKQLFQFQHRLKNGQVRTVDVYTCPISDGEMTLLYSIIFDVTDRERYRNELFQEKEALRVTLRSIGDGVVTTDETGRITSLNLAAQEITGWMASEAKGKRFSEVFTLRNEETGRPVENPIQKVLETGRTIGLANHTELIHRNSRALPIADSAAPIRAESGEIIGVVMVFRDVSSEKEHGRQIRYLSDHDHLTGLSNRRYIEEAMPAFDVSENLPIAVVMGDVNGLKITNDVFGHEMGDRLLQHMAVSIKRHCRAEDMIARWGGDEVVIFMPCTDLERAEEIVRHIKEEHLCAEMHGLRMSISFGCAVKERPEESIESVLRKAEEYMYHQKLLDSKSYRNAVINTLLATLYEKSYETEEHSERLEHYCRMIGARLRLSAEEMNQLSLLAVLHDIGKVSIDPDILLKPGRLTPDEWEEMQRHAEIGYRIAQATPDLAMVAELILSHHERWDGRGYPRGLEGEEIPLSCRILAVVDAFDAMTNDRIYRKAVGYEAAIAEIVGNAGTQFDPAIAAVFAEILMDEAAVAQQ